MKIKIFTNTIVLGKARKPRKRRTLTVQLMFAPIGVEMAKGILAVDDNEISASLVFKDKKGNVALPFGVPQWSLSADNVVGMTVAADGMSAQFVPTSVGLVTVNVLAEGEEAVGEQPIALSGEIEVVAADAETGELSFGPVT